MKFIFNSMYIALLITLFFAIKSMIDPRAWNIFWHWLPGDYPMLWDKYFAAYFTLSSPITLVIFAMFVLGVARVAVERKRHDYR